MGSDDTITVELPVSLVSRIEAIMEDSGFDSVSAYITHVLTEKLTETGSEQENLTEEEQIIKERLRGLGYLD